MRIIVLESDQNLRQLYGHIFDGLGGDWDVLEAGTCAAAIDIVQAEEVDLIVACHDLAQGETSIPLLQYLEKINYSSPVMLLSVAALSDLRLPWFGSRSTHHFFQMPIELETLAEKVGMLMYNRYDADLSIDQNFVKTKLAYFLRFNRAKCDVFVRLSASKLVKVISAGDHYGEEDIEKYRRRGIRYLYISNEDYERFCPSLEGCTFLELDLDHHQEQNLYWRKSHRLLRMLLEEYGISSSTIQVATQIVDQTIQQAMQSSFAKEFFRVSNQEIKNYLYDHTYLVAVVGSGILKNLKSVSHKELESFCLFTLFHDISHSDQHLAKIKGIGDKSYADLSFEQKKNFLAAIKESGQLYKNNSFFGRRVKLTADEYYSLMMSASPAGRLVVENLSLLTRVFLISHDFVNDLLELDFESEHSNHIINRLLKRYECGDYVKVVHALVSCHENYDLNLQ